MKLLARVHDSIDPPLPSPSHSPTIYLGLVLLCARRVAIQSLISAPRQEPHREGGLIARWP